MKVSDESPRQPPVFHVKCRVRLDCSWGWPPKSTEVACSIWFFYVMHVLRPLHYFFCSSASFFFCFSNVLTFHSFVCSSSSFYPVGKSSPFSCLSPSLAFSLPFLVIPLPSLVLSLSDPLLQLGKTLPPHFSLVLTTSLGCRNFLLFNFERSRWKSSAFC